MGFLNYDFTMSKLTLKVKNPFRTVSELSQSRWQVASHISLLAWYTALFPGRLGSDPVQAITKMRAGESTDWWSSLYFWFLRLTTFNGQSIWLASLLSAVTLYMAFIYFINSLPAKKEILHKVQFFVCLFPLFGNFAVNINHDTFFTSGVFIISGISLRKYLENQIPTGFIAPYAALFCLLNSKTGFFVIALYLLMILVFDRQLVAFTKYLSFTLVVFLITSLGITKSPVPMELMPAMADIKCVTQHPDARITDKEWEYLSTIAEIDLWKKPLSCASMDDAVNVVRSATIEEIQHVPFLKNYLKIATRNPAIVIQAHFQRGSQALPPPFFQGPQNQVDRDIRNPVGLNTNIALQLGPEVLHPSIDDPTLKLEHSYLKVPESIALFFSFLINQASWFWGWGGLWLWPILLFQVVILRIRSARLIWILNYPLILNHLIHVAVGPIPVPRYVMSTILIGFIYTSLATVIWFDKSKQEKFRGRE
jgi:hypothetical protein